MLNRDNFSVNFVKPITYIKTCSRFLCPESPIGCLWRQLYEGGRCVGVFSVAINSTIRYLKSCVNKNLDNFGTGRLLNLIWKYSLDLSKIAKHKGVAIEPQVLCRHVFNVERAQTSLWMHKTRSSYTTVISELHPQLVLLLPLLFLCLDH